jgi:uncharacterized repeat protein (TIGR03803 family)
MNSTVGRRWAAPLAAASFIFLSLSSKGGGLSIVNLHSFGLFANGAAPFCRLVQGSNGLFYGTTFQGGSANAGVVFEVASNGVMSALYSFTNGVDGAYSQAGLVLANDGNFYGTAYDGGAGGSGTIFQITPAGVFKLLYSFSAVNEEGNNLDGSNPSAGLLQAANGTLYGTTSSGGANGSGTLFQISLDGSFKLVYTFSALDIKGNNREGCSPVAELIEGNDDNLYGTASEGGTNGLGAVFRYNLTQGTMSPLYSFSGASDGSKPLAALVQGSDDHFYGTASEGGTEAFGALFKMSSSGAVTPLYSFTNGMDGGNPVAPLLLGTNGSFYGTSTGPQNGFGTVFEMTANGSLTLLYAFTGGNDGAYPQAGLVEGSDGNFYGTTSAGGTNNEGAVFSVSSAGGFRPVMSFVGGFDGEEPQAPLAQGDNGNFYGTTYQGGSAGNGVIFEMTAAGGLTSLYAFTNGADGANPAGGLAQGSDGNFYGSTVNGGANHVGVLFRLSPQGALTVLHALTNRVEGAHPQGGLLAGSDGNFYGTTYQGGASSEGAIFQMTPAGAVTPMYAFTNGADGGYPKGGLVEGLDGNFYGTTTLGGTNNQGTIFKVTPQGVLTPLYSFTNGADGATPECALALGADGSFYGTATNGGSQGVGVVYKVTAAGVLTPLYSFTNGVDGAMPVAGLVEGADGNFYGAASSGGTYFMGTLYEISPAGNFTPLHSFAGAADGADPLAPLVQGNDGNFYGTAASGGAADSGTAFRLGHPAPVTLSVNWTTPAGITYGTALSSAQLNASANVSGNFTYTPAAGTVLSAGIHTLSVIFNPTDTLDYSSVIKTVNLMVSPAPLTVAASNRAKTYGQTVTFAGTEFITFGLLNSDTVSSVTLVSSGTAASAAVAGSPYNIVPSEAVGTGLANYTINYAEGALSVSPAPLTVTAENQTKTYGQTLVFGSESTQFTASGLQNGESIASVTLAVSASGGAPTAFVGSYTITPNLAAGGTFNSANYTITYLNGALSVGPAPLTVTAKNQSKTYGQTVAFAGTEFTTSGLLNNDAVSSVTLMSSGAAASATVAASPYAIVPSAAAGSGLANYTITYANGALTVNPAALTITANNRAKTFGQTVTFAGTEFSASGLLNGDTVASVTLASPGAAASATVAGSPYPIVPSAAVGTGLANYAISYVNGLLTVSAGGLAVTWTNPAAIIYGAALGSSQLNASANVAGSFAYMPASGSVLSAGTNVLTAVFTPNDAVDYNIVTNTVDLVVRPAPLSVTAVSTNRLYGRANPAFAALLLGVTNGDNITATASCGASAASPVGSYSIVPGTAAGSDLTNYAITYADGTLTVDPAALTITANSRGKTYGQTVTFAGTEFSTGGLVNGDTVASVALSSAGAAAIANVGSSPYAIMASAAQGTGLANYTITYLNGALSVSPAPLTVTAKNQSKTYGQTVAFAGTEFTTSGLLNNDAVSSVTLMSSGAAASATVAASPYAIVPSAAAGSGLANYTITYANGALTVNPAALTITANNRAKTFGQTVTFAGTEFSASGLLNGDTVASVTLASPGAAASATVAGSPYPIVPSAAVGTGLANYAISYVDGILTVTAISSQPYLSFVFSRPNLILSWPTSASAFGLVRASTLDSSTTWTPVTSGISINGTSNTITINAGFGNQYYKLVAP